jgi:acetyl esterase/lipase
MKPPTSGDGYHPDLRATARLAPRTTITNATTMRVMRWLTALRRPRAAGVDIVPCAGSSMRIYRGARTSQRHPALLWMHGGGYVMGRAHLDDRLCQAFAHALGITVGSVDYRLAPEHPYPTALEDCYAALHRLADLPGVDPQRIAIGGLSSGAGLAAALAARLRGRRDIAPVHQLLAYPMLDDRSAKAAHPRAAQYRFWNQKSNQFCWRAYLADADPAVAVPACLVDLAGLPSAWIGVGSLDLFHDESVVYAERLRAAGVACELDVVAGAVHGFDAVAPKAPVVGAFFARQCISLNNAFRCA